jgi:energy-coupling factor transporter ATP-binding protein EcfA2
VIILSLLLHLNRDECITLIMVTHDQSLSLYGHRVVHMLDGKIVRIVSSSDESRRGAEIALAAKLRSLTASGDLKGEWMSWSGHWQSAQDADAHAHPIVDSTQTAAVSAAAAAAGSTGDEVKSAGAAVRVRRVAGFPNTEIRNPDTFYSFLAK